MTKLKHRSHYRIYYEDTDAGGVVYYANYLKFAERARTEWLRDLDFSQQQLAQEENILFVVRRAEIELLKPARLDDKIEVETVVTEIKGPKLHMDQTITCGEVLAEIKVLIICTNTDLKPVRLPKAILDKVYTRR